MRAALRYAWRALLAGLLLTALTFLSVVLLSGFQEFPRLRLTGGALLLRLLTSKFLVAAVLTYPAMRSRWVGSQLICAIFVVHFGVYTFLPQSEALLVLSEHITPATTALITAHGFLVAVLFSFGLVAISGKLLGEVPERESARLHMGVSQWLWRLALCLAARLALKGCGVALFRFGGNGAAEAWEAAGPLGWVVLQTGQAALLVFFSLPLIKMMRGGRLETGLTVAAVLCVLGAVSPLIMADPFLPETVSASWAIEMGLSNFAYGALVGYLFSYSESAGRGPF